MENHTRYRLKSEEELRSVLEGIDQVLLVACNKCFQNSDHADDADLSELKRIADENGVTVTGTAGVDFLCSAAQTGRRLRSLIQEETEYVLVLSCGLGIQTVADLTRLPVFSAADTLNPGGHHGMALTDKGCDACAQCYLNMTGGICPVTDCAKSLLNGQCGGAKNGKCEVSPDRDCAWEKIRRRLERQGRMEELLHQPVQIRDFSRTDFKVIHDYVKAVREKRQGVSAGPGSGAAGSIQSDGFRGGIHPVEGKDRTRHLALKRFPDPQTAVFPLSMHAGAPAVPVVKPGDIVAVGQKIAKAGGAISAPVHASVSGRVAAIELRPHAVMGQGMAIVIENDGKNTLHESVRPGKALEQLTSDEIIRIVKEAGIVGMGGAGFPTWVKLCSGKPVDTVLLNGCECEPVLTADHRVMLEYADEVVFGLRAIMKAVGAAKGVIVIEDNKPDAVSLMKEITAGTEEIKVCTLRTAYPQGAEKNMIRQVTGRSVPPGGLPADAGCVVDNVSTAKAIADAIRTGMPLIERAVTVSGEGIPDPGNYIVKTGTCLQDLILACSGHRPEESGEIRKEHSSAGKDQENGRVPEPAYEEVIQRNCMIRTGGPMMGTQISDLNAPVMKGTNGVIVTERDPAKEQDCIRCGRCVEVCPQELFPLRFVRLADQENWQEMIDHRVMDCIECRCCDYICSSRISIVSRIRTGKAVIRGMRK